VVGNGSQSGPFGYVDKGTFFTDETFTEFPEKIEIVYQVVQLELQLLNGK
jgi:hypothetical protein